MTIEQQEQQQKSELLPKEGAALGTTGMTLGEQLRPQSPELTPKEAEALRVWLAGLAHEDRRDAANCLVNAWIAEPDIPVRDIVLTGLAQFVVYTLLRHQVLPISRRRWTVGVKAATGSSPMNNFMELLEFTPSECLEITAAVAHGVAPLVSRTPSEELYAEVIDTAAQCGLPVIESIRRRHAAAGKETDDDTQ